MNKPLQGIMGKWLALLLIASSCANAAQRGDLRYILKGSRASLSLPARRMTFGLNAQQVNAILELTAGEVNFGDVYALDAPISFAREIRKLKEYSATLRPGTPPPYMARVTPDPELDGQWWIRHLNVPQAWTMASGAGVTIADCDAGYYIEESDLKRNLLLQYAFNFSDPKHPTRVDEGPYVSHGTAVAAIMAGVLDGKGTNGIAYNAKLIPFQNYNYEDGNTIDKEEATAKCVLKAIATPNVNLIVLENQTDSGSSETFVGTRDAVRLAIKAGIPVVSAAGNSSLELAVEAKDDTGSIIVGAITQDELAEDFSNWGDRITVGAYGERLYTLHGPNGQFDEFGGTSGAAPQVAAAVALMLELNPRLTPRQVRQILLSTRQLTYSTQTVGGKLDVAAAVRQARGTKTETSEAVRSWIFRERLSAILTGSEPQGGTDLRDFKPGRIASN